MLALIFSLSRILPALPHPSSSVHPTAGSVIKQHFHAATGGSKCAGTKRTIQFHALKRREQPALRTLPDARKSPQLPGTRRDYSATKLRLVGLLASLPEQARTGAAKTNGID